MGSFRRVLGIAAAFVLLGLTWALASPQGSAPDDSFHLTSIYCAWGEAGGACQVGSPPRGRPSIGVLVREDVADVSCSAGQPAASADCLAGLSTEPVLARSNGVLYPPLFYGVMRAFAGDSVAWSVFLMRMVSVLLAALLLAAALALAPRGAGIRTATVVAWGCCLVPLGLFVIASTNPSAWAVLGVGTFWSFLATVLEVGRWGRRRIAAAVLAGFSAVVAVGARYDSLLYLAVAAAAVALVRCRRPSRRAAWLLAASVLAGVTLLLAVVTLTAQGRGLLQGLSPADEGVDAFDRLVSNILDVPSLVAGALGTWELGVLDVPLPGVVWVSAMAAFFGATFLGLASGGWRKVAALALVATALFVPPLVVLYNGLDPVGEQVQPRYLLPLLVAGVGIAVLPARNGPVMRLRGLQPWVWAALLAVANAAALATTIRRYVTGLDVPLLDQQTPAEWWWSIPIGPWVVAFFGAVAGVLLFGLLAWDATGPAEDDLDLASELAPNGPPAGVAAAPDPA